MSIFSSILQKIGLGKKSETPAAAPNAAADAAAKAKADAAVTEAMAKAAAEAKARVAAQANAAAAAPVTPVAAPASVVPAAVQAAAIPVVDVVSKLEGLAKSHPGLNWKVSIVDLLKLLDLDSSFDARKELATELGCPANLMNDSASMNTWLHQTVLQKIAENGGNIPAALLQSEDAAPVRSSADRPDRREQL
jgi:hypothetical protein